MFDGFKRGLGIKNGPALFIFLFFSTRCDGNQLQLPQANNVKCDFVSVIMSRLKESQVV